MSTRREPWALSQHAFDSLLAHLDPDRERAGQLYEDLRRRLVLLFQCRGAASPEDSADETLDRVSRRLAEGERIRDLPSYVAGVARRVAHEDFRRRIRARRAPAIPLPSTARDVADFELRSRCLMRCLYRLPAEERDLILTYSRGDWRSRVLGRRSLALRAGISSGALRMQAHRIRERLRACVAVCAKSGCRDSGRSEPPPAEGPST